MGRLKGKTHKQLLEARNQMRELLDGGISPSVIADRFGVTRATVYNCRPKTKRKKWYKKRNVDYSKVDWSRPVKDIAEGLGVSHQAVYDARAKYAPKKD